MNHRMAMLVYSAVFIGIAANASDLTSETNAGTGTFSQGFTYNGEQKSGHEKERYKNEVDGRYNWSLGYTYATTTLGATSGAATGAGTDHSNTFTGGVGYSQHWSAGFDLSYSNTKEEHLDSFGPSIYAGYTFDLADRPKPSQKEDDEDTDEPFTPTLNVKLSLGATTYTQTLQLAARPGGRKNPNAAGPIAAQSIMQKPVEISATLSPFEWIDIKLAYTKFNYNKDVVAFIARLDEPRAIRSGASTFGSTLSGFSSKEVTLDLTWHLPLDLDFETELTQAESAIDAKKTNAFKADLSREWIEKFKTGLGFERSKSAAQQENVGILTLGYLF